MFCLAITTVALSLAAAAQAKCDAGCAVPVKHYEEIGCEPVYAAPEDCCPTHYNCAKVTGRAADKCFFRGKAYEKGDRLDNQLTGENCAASCFCEKNEWHDFTCANIECPEFFGTAPLQPGCFRVYEDGQCCSSKTVCPPLEKLATCKVGDKTYYEGQRFEAPEPAGSCLTCTCKPGFDGKFVAPFCTTLSCGVELRYSHNINKNCAPVFYGTGRCCPIQWQCAETTDTIVPVEKPGSGEKCSYGDKKLNIGDKVLPKPYSEHSPEITCECRMPPLVTCTQKPYEN